jgi:predicted GIY-YIG superfamily endonuclease
MGGRSRPFGRRGRGRRSPLVGAMSVGWVLAFRLLPGPIVAFYWACRAHPIVAFGVLTYFAVWFGSGSGLVAMAATPALWLLGAWLFFRVRMARTGLSMRDAAGQVKRERRVRAQWGRACQAAGLGVAPHLSILPWKPSGVRSEGETVVAKFDAAGAGLAREPILSGLTSMAQVVAGGCRAARMTALGDSGWVEVRFTWAGDPLRKVITPNDIPAAELGTAPYGVAETGAPVARRLVNARGEWVFTPLLIVGITGSGKSGALWATLLGMIHAGVPVHLHVSDPKGGMELTAFEDALNDGLGTPLFKVVEYADTEEKTTAMVKRMAALMDERAKANKVRRVRAHVPTVADPAHVLIIDELLELEALMKAGKAGALGRLQRLGRACGFSVIAATQLSRAADLNPQIRDLFPQREVFRVPSREAVETALGSGMGWSERAPAHTIGKHEKGVGWTTDFENGEDTTTAVRFRAVYVEDEMTREIAAGEIPAGADRYARESLDATAFGHAVYRLYDEGMSLLYVGESNNPPRRFAEHARSKAWWDEVVQDSDHMVVTWYRAGSAREAERLAKVQESHAIRTELPRYNQAENQRNPLQVIRGGRGRRAA